MADSITRNAMRAEVLRRGWVFEPLTSDDHYYRIVDTNGNATIGRGSRLSSGSANGLGVSRNKLWSYEFLERSGFRIPGFLLYQTHEASLDFLTQYGRIVVKPIDGEQSKGVTVDVSTPEQLQRAVEYAEQYSKSGKVVLQEQLEGELYRLLVVGDKLFAASCRRAPFVTGDGISSVEQLIDAKNSDPLRSDDGKTPLKRIKKDLVLQYLQPDVMQSVLTPGEELRLLPIASVSMGGESEDVTDSVNQALVQTVVRVTKELGLVVCGFDLIIDDISQAREDGYLPIAEMNSLPGFKLHLFPTAGGVPRDPSAAIIDLEFAHKGEY